MAPAVSFVSPSVYSFREYRTRIVQPELVEKLLKIFCKPVKIFDRVCNVLRAAGAFQSDETGGFPFLDICSGELNRSPMDYKIPFSAKWYEYALSFFRM